MKWTYNRFNRFLLSICCLCAAFFLASCSYNPVTGTKQYNIVSTQEEIKIGKQAHPYIKRMYGVYPNKRLQAYVNEIGQKLAAVSERDEIEYSFTVLDSPVINAFALPGGFLYVTRGALAQMNSEAELAFVLGHEISHVSAKHGAQRLSQQRSIGMLQVLAQIMTQKEDLGLAGRVVNTGINLAVLGYGREHEFESDLIGLHYAHCAHYDTKQGARFLNTLKRQEKYEPGWLSNFLSSHPPTNERIDRAMNKNIELDSDMTESNEKAMIKRDEFLREIEGIFMGPGSVLGQLEKGVYINQHYEMAFTPPKRWEVEPGSDPEQFVVLRSRRRGAYSKGTLFIRPLDKKTSLDSFIENQEKQLFDRHNKTVIEESVITLNNGIKAKKVSYKGTIDEMGSGYFYMLYCVNQDFGYVLAFSQNILEKYDTFSEIDRSLNSFRFLSEKEKKDKKIYRLTIHNVKNGENLVSLSKTYFDKDDEEERILAFNDFQEGKILKVGELVKIPPYFKKNNLKK